MRIPSKPRDASGSSFDACVFNEDVKCTQCGEPGANATGMCASCLHQSYVDSRARAGLPPTIEDEDALDHLARLFKGSTETAVA